jgi:hypothetical protein
LRQLTQELEAAEATYLRPALPRGTRWHKVGFPPILSRGAEQCKNQPWTTPPPTGTMEGRVRPRQEPRS